MEEVLDVEHEEEDLDNEDEEEKEDLDEEEEKEDLDDEQPKEDTDSSKAFIRKSKVALSGGTAYLFVFPKCIHECSFDLFLDIFITFVQREICCQCLAGYVTRMFK